MVTLVAYDISDNRERREMETLCRDHGLRRVQRSFFRGRLDPQRRTSLMDAIEEAARDDLESQTWDVQVYAIADDDYPAHRRFQSGGPIEDSLDFEEVIIL